MKSSFVEAEREKAGSEVRLIFSNLTGLGITICLAAALSWSVAARAVPPEGLDAFAVSGHGAAAAGSTLFANYGYVNPFWSADYQALQAYVTTQTASGNLWSYGASLTTVNHFGDRDNYFVTYDQKIYGQFISLKFAHSDLNLVPMGQNIFSLDYNVAFHIGTHAEFYLLAGVYYRYDLDAWHPPTWSPINLNTDNQDAYVEIVFGTRIALGKTDFLTVDLNNRDPFLPYNGDDIALDFTVNFVTSDKFTFRLTASTRFSGLLVGTADVNEERILLGIVGRL